MFTFYVNIFSSPPPSSLDLNGILYGENRLDDNLLHVTRVRGFIFTNILTNIHGRSQRGQEGAFAPPLESIKKMKNLLFF